jgi:hypothetical protein
MAHHRYRTANMLGCWCLSHDEACGDAIRAGQARRDETRPDHVLWAVPGEIESRGENSTH